jgi:hypothetical protein
MEWTLFWFGFQVIERRICIKLLTILVSETCKNAQWVRNDVAFVEFE